MPARDRPLGQVRVVAAAVDTDRLLGEIQFDDRSDTTGQKLPIMRDDDHAYPLALHEALESVQSVQIQIVGRFVQQ